MELHEYLVLKQKVTKKEIQEILLHYADRYNQLSFIEQDPISIPHQFHRKQDIEIIGFWVYNYYAYKN